MLEEIISYVSQFDPAILYIIIFLFSFIENVFPPSPSDVIVVFGASLIATTAISFIPILVITSVGSALGFMVMYFLGKWFGDSILRKGKIKFISQEQLKKTDLWFHKYGMKLILANRFLPGTRSVISFFAGMSGLKIASTFTAALISATLWNALIIFVGFEIGKNYKLLDKILAQYSEVVLLLTAAAAVIFTIRYFMNRKKNGTKKDEN